MKKIKTFIKIGILILALQASITCAASQPEKSFLWEVKYQGNTSYLLGSIHMMKKSAYPLPSIIESSFDKCQCLGVEMNIADEKMMDIQIKLLKIAKYPPGENLKQNLSPKIYELTKKALEKLGMNINGMQGFKPWFIGTLMAQVQLLKAGFNPQYGIDKHFINLAKKNKKTILELEGVDFQIDLFKNLTPKEQEHFLHSTILDLKMLTSMTDQLVQAWKQGDTRNMDKLMNENTSKYPELKEVMKKLLEDRNYTMTDTIISWIKSGKKCFIVVGAAHLVGREGIVSLLKKKGFSLRQL
jgi:uncharacterized protein YbaP (TraB family)